MRQQIHRACNALDAKCLLQRCRDTHLHSVGELHQPLGADAELEGDRSFSPGNALGGFRVGCGQARVDEEKTHQPVDEPVGYST
jgi:hypothetical protein